MAKSFKTGISVDGDVGIGTTSPAEPLHVVTASGDAYLRQDNGTATTYLGPDGSNTGLFGTSTAHDVRFITDNTERVRIDTSGNVGIGNASPTQELDVTGTVTATALAVTGQFTLPTADGTADQVLVTNGSGTVSWADQSGGGGGTTIPAGTVVMYGGGTAPSGWLVCDGSAVSRTTYSDLFTAISTRYGTGDGSTTFNLPGTSALVPVGIAASGNADGTTVSGSSTLNALALGDQSADHSHTITSNAGNQSADHSHAITVDSGNANHSHTITVANANANHSHTITVDSANANHRHSWSKNFNTTNQNASHTHGYFKTNNSNVSANTNNQKASHSHNFNSGTVNTNYANAGHSHTANSGAVNATHAHNANSAAANAAHSHNASSGNNSVDHNHTITSNAGNQSANHNHALTSSTVSTTINVEPFLFIIKT